MGIVCTVIEIDETTSGNAVTFGFPDESNQVTVDAGDDDLQGLQPGAQFTVAFVPFVSADHPAASDQPGPAGGAGLVPADHPVVIDPSSASAADPAADEEPATQSGSGQ